MEVYSPLLDGRYYNSVALKSREKLYLRFKGIPLFSLYIFLFSGYFALCSIENR